MVEDGVAEVDVVVAAEERDPLQAKQENTKGFMLSALYFDQNWEVPLNKKHCFYVIKV